jgi:DNA-binding NarL/FixJ family response regulator
VGVAVVDDDRQARRLVLGVFQTSPEFQCCGCFSTAAEALDAIPKLPVRIALVGLSLPDLCGIQCIQALRLFRPNLRIILTAAANTDPSVLRRALAAGADTCCLKPLHAEQCLAILRAAAARCVPHHSAFRLTEREEQILQCLAEGLAYKEIGERLAIGVPLLKKLQQRIFKKLHAHSRVLAVNKWRQGG